MAENNEIPENENIDSAGGENSLEEGVQSQSIVSEMKEAYLDYAMSVITSRALPDVRDGLKPVHRRILYAMRGMGLTSGAKFRKSAAVVGEVLGKYHPHGDSAVYDSMVNMAQDFSFRYPLVIGQGNFGSIDGDNAAAMRYTEAKMSKISGELLSDIEKDTVDFRDNYDGTIQEPEVLPAAVPGLLLNGTLGIAVGMATNIPPHNLGELIDGLVMLIEEDNVTNKDLVTVIKGPDFPTGAILFGAEDIAEAYSTGRGSMVVRGEAEIVEPKANKFEIIIRSLPYRLKKSDLIVKIANLVKDKRIEGIKDIRDESTSDIRIVIELKSSSQPQKILNQLYKYTPLEDKFHLNLVALHEGVPQTMSLKDVLEAFLAHRQIVIRRRTEYELRRAEAREHILLGLKKALDHIDEIIAIIKKSRTRDTAKENLIKKFKFSDRQVEAILQMQLQRLAGLERKKIEDELKDIQKFIKELKDILSSEKNILAVVKEELLAVREKYQDERRTKIVEHSAKNFSMEDLIPNTESVLVFTSGGYVKRTDPSEYKKQHRGGRGVSGQRMTKEEDVTPHLQIADTHDYLLFFTDRGRVFASRVFELPADQSRNSRGTPVQNLGFNMEPREQVQAVVAVQSYLEDTYLIMATKKGQVKRMHLPLLRNMNRSGLRCFNLKSDDALIGAVLANEDEDLVLVSRLGMSIRFKSSDIRPRQRAAGGMKGMAVQVKDAVVSMNVVDDEGYLLVVGQKGVGKLSLLRHYTQQRRGGKGLITLKTQSKKLKNNHVADSAVVSEDVRKDSTGKLVLVTEKAQVIRTNLGEIASTGRNTSGVWIQKPQSGDRISAIRVIGERRQAGSEIDLSKLENGGDSEAPNEGGSETEVSSDV